MKTEGKKADKQWQTPELIALVRSKPEETVLTSCKGCSNPPAPGPSNGSNDCDNGTACYACFKS